MRAVLLGMVVVVVGCGGSSGGGHAIDAGGSHDGGAGHDGDMIDGAPVTCSPGAFGGGETSLATEQITAKIVDETGAAVANQVAYICGLDLCSDPHMTAADGTISILSNLMEKRPAFEVGDGLAYGELAIPLTQAVTDFTTGGGKIVLGHVGAQPGQTLTPGTTVSSGDVIIDIPAGATVSIDPLIYATPDQQKLRTTRIPLADNVDAVVMASAPVTGFGALYAVAPAETPICPPAKVTAHLPSNVGWSAGDAVEFWITTLDVGQAYGIYAGWTKVSDGIVNPDGVTASTLDGQGFDYLTTFAIRKKT